MIKDSEESSLGKNEQPSSDVRGEEKRGSGRKGRKERGEVEGVGVYQHAAVLSGDQFSQTKQAEWSLVDREADTEPAFLWTLPISLCWASGLRTHPERPMFWSFLLGLLPPTDSHLWRPFWGPAIFGHSLILVWSRALSWTGSHQTSPIYSGALHSSGSPN
ncbi:unnamed protein product [Coregonus sp. 'balchen']|nr:unnamed protein product [Coregonus sp. 'balchen']